MKQAEVYKKNLVFILAFGLSFVVYPGFGQNTSHPNKDSCTKFCEPGVVGQTPGSGLEIGIETVPNTAFYGPNDNTIKVKNNRRIYGELRFPVLLQPSFKLLGEVNFSKQEFKFENDQQASTLPNNLHDKDLKSTGITLYGIKSLNEKNYVGLRASFGFNGEYTNTIASESQKIKASLAAIYGIKPSDHVEYGFGLASSYWNQSYSLIPVFRYNYTKEDFGIEALLPKEVSFRYNLKDNTSVWYAGAEYAGQEYLLNGQGNNHLLYDNAALRFKTTFEQRIVPWVWVTLKAGYQTSIDFTFQPNNEQGSIPEEQDGSLFGGIEISLRPPDDVR